MSVWRRIGVPSDFRPSKRMRDPEALKRFRLENAGTLCWFCDLKPGIHVHHRIHRSQGGGDVPENLVWLCGACHDEAHGVRGIWNL
jgi:5-methylcytosine-specific restriction endonuclease McrA